MSARGGVTGQTEASLARPALPRIRRRNRLRLRLAFLLGCALGALVLYSGGISYLVVRDGETTAWRGRQGETARAAASTVAIFVRGAVDSMTLLGRNDISTQPETMRWVLAQNPALQELIQVDARGRILAGVSRDKTVLSNLITIPQSQWFKVSASGHTYLGDVQVSATNEPYMIIALPAPDGEVIAGRLRMNVLWDVVGDIRFGKSGRAFIVDGAGEVIAHTDPQVVLTNTDLRTSAVAGIAALSQAWSGSYRNFEGIEVVAATAAVPGTNWVIVTELSKQEAFAVTEESPPQAVVGDCLVRNHDHLAGRGFSEPHGDPAN